MDDDEYVWVQPQDYDAESRCRDLQRQVRELQAAQMRWEIHRMDLEMQLMTERSARHHDLHAVEDELHREKQAVRLLAHEQAKQAALVTDLRAQLLPHTRHKRKMVTPEVIAAHHATRIACDVVVDAFTGCGGNAIQLAMTCRHVIAIDVDPAKIAIAKHNATIYGVADRIEWIVGDSFAVLPRLHHADVVFLVGPAYLNQNVFSLQDMRMGMFDGIELFKIAAAVTKDIVYFVPRNVDTKQVKLLQESNEEVAEVEFNYLNHKLKTVTMYFGSLACVGDCAQQGEEGDESEDDRSHEQGVEDTEGDTTH
ncbi:hypothetical protein DYB25_007700 [Aphanomyces astaci]|uniref:Trimethylguanosine synthase n=1 Tax=Aphanomyces astaci TaxID=112090 RepID=A0A397F5M0_APHAT|nr:hypothetical protein DYB25_007700 [Aphanomyces astaci]RHY53478.1 hypothetical protein DYB34_006234 [Aphanomyces astaci]RHY84753.1 hypothetical protein DYB35_009052 [Aphanomyces astaci]RHZ16194.1 hypothetical protein DYB31_002684 [Aphanomyces astaci]RHZ16423.1 hypothetical protein DYB26_003707 [Aphanomyces astaci]